MGVYAMSVDKLSSNADNELIKVDNLGTLIVLPDGNGLVKLDGSTEVLLLNGITFYLSSLQVRPNGVKPSLVTAPSSENVFGNWLSHKTINIFKETPTTRFRVGKEVRKDLVSIRDFVRTFKQNDILVGRYEYELMLEKGITTESLVKTSIDHYIKEQAISTIPMIGNLLNGKGFTFSERTFEILNGKGTSTFTSKVVKYMFDNNIEYEGTTPLKKLEYLAKAFDIKLSLIRSNYESISDIIVKEIGPLALVLFLAEMIEIDSKGNWKPKSLTTVQLEERMGEVGIPRYSEDITIDGYNVRNLGAENFLIGLLCTRLYKINGRSIGLSNPLSSYKQEFFRYFVKFKTEATRRDRSFRFYDSMSDEHFATFTREFKKFLLEKVKNKFSAHKDLNKYLQEFSILPKAWLTKPKLTDGVFTFRSRVTNYPLLEILKNLGKDSAAIQSRDLGDSYKLLEFYDYDGAAIHTITLDKSEIEQWLYKMDIPNIESRDNIYSEPKITSDKDFENSYLPVVGNYKNFKGGAFDMLKDILQHVNDEFSLTGTNLYFQVYRPNQKIYDTIGFYRVHSDATKNFFELDLDPLKGPDTIDNKKNLLRLYSAIMEGLSVKISKSSNIHGGRGTFYADDVIGVFNRLGDKIDFSPDNDIKKQLGTYIKSKFDNYLNDFYKKYNIPDTIFSSSMHMGVPHSDVDTLFEVLFTAKKIESAYRILLFVNFEQLHINMKNKYELTDPVKYDEWNDLYGDIVDANGRINKDMDAIEAFVKFLTGITDYTKLPEFPTSYSIDDALSSNILILDEYERNW